MSKVTGSGLPGSEIRMEWWSNHHFILEVVKMTLVAYDGIDVLIALALPGRAPCTLALRSWAHCTLLWGFALQVPGQKGKTFEKVLRKF